jgi:hypothetical protein
MMRTRYLIVPLAMALASGVAAMPLMRAQAAVDITVTVAPPPIPVYEQPPLPGPGYMWTPGYWAYDAADGYYWVPGTWVEPPEVGLLWTPGYWAWENNDYAWNAGYWGPTVGFYGGIDYGFGYTGDGFYGGRWDHGHFAYNTAVWNTGGAHVANSYRQAVTRHEGNRVSFTGGHGGLTARPSAAQEQAAHARHVQATAPQTRQESAARQDPRLRATANHGKPPVAATARAGDFKTHPIAATGAGGPMPAQTGPNAAAPKAGPNRTGTTAKPGVTPNERNAERPNGANPAERNAAAPNAMHPAERNAVRPNEAPPGERNAAGPNAAHPEAHGVTPNGAHPQARVPARPAEHPQAQMPQPQHQTEARPVQHRPARAEIPQAHHEVATEPRGPAARPMGGGGAPPHPMAAPAAAPHPAVAPHQAGPAERDRKQP